MKQNITIPTLFILGLIFSSTSLTNAMEIEGKETLDPNEPSLSGKRKPYVAFQDNPIQLSEDPNPNASKKVCSPVMKLIASLEECVREAQQSMNRAALAKMDQTFKTIHMEEESWQSLCQEKGYCKWPLQKTWKEAYGGYLFYPKKEIDKYNNFYYTRYLLNRKDIISGLEISMTYNYPVAQFMYLDRPYLDPQSEKYYDRIFKKVVKGLLEDEGAEAVQLKVHYLLNYADEELEDRIEEVIELLNRSPSVENRLQALNIRFRYKDCLITSQPSTKEEFLSFAEREKCGFAFRLALLHFGDSFSWEEKISLLEKAVEWGDMHALCILASFYKKKTRQKPWITISNMPKTVTPMATKELYFFIITQLPNLQQVTWLIS